MFGVCLLVNGNYFSMLKNKIQLDATKSLKQGDQELSGVLRLVLAAITSKEKEKRYKIFSLREMSRRDTKDDADKSEEDLIKKSELSDDEVIDTISSEIKKRKDAIVLYEKGNRPELAQKEKKEIEVLQKYLPEQLSLEELKRLVQESVSKVGAKEVKDIGKVMADLIPKVKGRADNTEVSRIIKELLSQ